MSNNEYKFIYSKVLLKVLLDKNLISQDEFDKALDNLKNIYNIQLECK